MTASALSYTADGEIVEQTNIHFASGNLGIGTAAPGAQLQIGPKDNDHLFLASVANNYGWMIDTDDQGNGIVPFRIKRRTAGTDTLALTIANQNGNVGIGTTTPTSTMHIYKNANEQTTGLIIEKESAGTGAAAIFFAVSSTAASEPASLAKGAILFQRSSTKGRGDLKFCVDYADDTNAVTSSDVKMTIQGGTGNVGIGTTSSIGNLSLGSATVVKSWNAFNNNSSAGNYTFPRNCVALVHFHFAGGQDLNISAVYRITMPYGGNPTIEVIYSGGYVNATVGHGAHVVRFYGQNLPSNYNSTDYQLRISQISYSGSI